MGYDIIEPEQSGGYEVIEPEVPQETNVGDIMRSPMSLPGPVVADASTQLSQDNPFSSMGTMAPYGTALEELSTGAIQLPRFRGESLPGKIGAGIWNVAAGIPEFLTSPLGPPSLAIGALPGWAARLAGVGFGASMAPAAGEAAGVASVTGDAQDITEAIGSGVMATLPALPAARMFSKKPFTPPEITPEVPNAIQPEATPSVRTVRQEPVQVAPEVPAQVQSRPVNEGGGKVSPAIKAPEIERVASLPASSFMQEVKASGVGMTKMAYNLGEQIAKGDIPALEAAAKESTQKQIDAFSEASKLTDQASKIAKMEEGVAHGSKQQYFSEAAKWRKALDESMESGITTQEQFAAVENKHGVGDNVNAGKSLMEAVERQRLSSEPVIESIGALDPATGSPLTGTDALINRVGEVRNVETKGAPNEKAKTPQGEEILGTTPPATPPAPPVAAASGQFAGENTRMRQLSERGTTAESVPTPVQEQIATAPESFYQQQSMAKVENAVKAMSDADLAVVPRDSEIFTAAKLEQSNRLFDQGKNAEGYQVFQDLSQELTRMGQVINQAKMLNAVRPEHVVTIVNESLKKAKRDPLTPDQATRLTELSKSRIETQRALDNATAEWVKEPTDANAVKAEKSLLDSNKAALEEQKMMHKFQNRSLAALLKSILQGGLLTPISQVANLFGNMSFMPFRAMDRSGATMIDVIDSSIRNRPREISVAPVEGTRAAMGGLLKGVKQIPDILKQGTGDVIKGEQRASLHPLRAWVTQFAKNPDAPTVGGKIPLSDRINLAIEGTLGVPAETMLRGLGAGDIAFREAARARLISEQSRLQRVPDGQKRMAQNFPELFFDKKTLNRIENETRGAIFQRHSPTLDHMVSWMKGKGDLFDLAIATVAPYKLTPWNIVGEILSYNPLIAMGKSALEAKRGNIRAAETNAAKAVVGSMLATSGWWLYQKGLLAPSMDSRDEQQKARILAGQILPPNHVNISGLKRAMEGGDPTFKPGDETRDIFRAGGLAGSMFYMMANIGRDMETKPETDDVLMSLLSNSTLEQARFGLNQSFLKGVTGLLDAVHEGDADTYIQSLANTVLSVPLPNTLSALSRAEREYKVDTKADTTIGQLGNVLKTRLGFAGLDDMLPIKRGLWGEPLPETPKDRNALLYHFFDITKGQQVTDDPVPLELYRLWRKTANTSVIPSPPEKTFTFAKQTYTMTPEQRSRYAELVGTARRGIVDKLVINPLYHKASDDEKIQVLKKAYDFGADRAKRQFWLESEGKLSMKPERVGFSQ
jgi:hypothetical protein